MRLADVHPTATPSLSLPHHPVRAAARARGSAPLPRLVVCTRPLTGVQTHGWFSGFLGRYLVQRLGEFFADGARVLGFCDRCDSTFTHTVVGAMVLSSPAD